VKDIYYDIDAELSFVTWKEPLFTDNVGVKKMIQNMKSGQRLSAQTYYIYYAAIDDAGNKAVCRFFLHVRAKTCDTKDLPGGEGASLSTVSFEKTLRVFLKCPAEKIFSQNETSFAIVTCNNGEWSQETFPDCVDFEEYTHPCRPGKVPNKRSFLPTVCSNCAKGTFQSGYVCKPCPVDTYQDQQGSTSCKICPVGTKTSKEGSRSITSCQVPCPEGAYSSTGYRDVDESIESCRRCPEGSYQSLKGQSSCSLCPKGGDSETGSTTKEACKFSAVIESMSPESQQISTFVNKSITIKCHATGSPKPTIVLAKVGGEVSERVESKNIPTGNEYITSMQLDITHVKVEDTGIYRCIATNVVMSETKTDTRDVVVVVKQLQER